MSQLVDNYQKKTWKAGDKLLASDITLMSSTLDSTENAVVDIQSTTIPSIQADYKESDKNIVDSLNATIGELPKDTTVVSYVKQQVADLVGTAPETLDTLKEVADAILVNKDTISALESVVTKNRESIDSNTSKLGTVTDNLDELASKAATYTQFEYQDGDETINRKTIQLDNFDTISGITTTGLAVNLATVNKFDVAEFGSAQVHVNISSKNNEVTINDTLKVATDVDLDTKVSKTDFNDTVATLAVSSDVTAKFEAVEKTISDNQESADQALTNAVDTITASYKQADSDLHTTISSETDEKVSAVSKIANAAATKVEFDGAVTSINEELSLKANSAKVDEQVATVVAKFDDYYTADQVDTKLVTVYKASGNVDTFEDLSKLENVANGNVYNVLDNGKNYVAIIDDQGTISWDDLGGIVDLSAYITSDEVASKYQTIETSQSKYNALDQAKVDKIVGKQLSTNDFDDDFKSKLEGIEESANNYTLPEATKIVLGGVIVGTGIDVENGTISANKDFIIAQTSEHFETIEKTVSDLSDKVDDRVSVINTKIDTTKSDLESIINTKADASTLNDYVLTTTLSEQLTPYAKSNDVTEKLAAKLDASAIGDYALKANVFTKEEVKTALDKKLDVEDANEKFDSIAQAYKDADSALVSDYTSKIDAVSVVASVAAVKSDVDAQFETANEAIDTKLSISDADTKFDQVEESISAISDVANAAAVKSDVDSKFESIDANIALKADITKVNSDIATVTSKFDDYYTIDQVDAKLVSAYKASGNVETVEALDSIEGVVNGNVYNVVENGKNYVAIIDEDGNITWDDLGGFVDLTDYAKSKDVSDTYKTITSAQEDFDLLDQSKVDKIDGKQLSANDFTDDYKNKLDGIEASANNYTLPQASSNVLGGVKIGEGVDVSEGVVSVNAEFVKSQFKDDVTTLTTSIDDAKTQLQSSIDTKLDKSVIDGYYSSADVDEKLADKLDASEIAKYSTSEDIQSKLDLKLNASVIEDYYDKTAVDEALSSKLNESQVQAKIDDSIASKADSTTVSTLESTLTGLIDAKVGNDTFVVELAKKINTEDANVKFESINDTLTTKADASDVTEKLAAKLDVSEITKYSTTEDLNKVFDTKLDIETANMTFDTINETLETKANSSDVDEKLDAKLNASEIDNYSTKNQMNDSVADIPVLLAQISQLQDRIKALEIPSQQQIEVSDDNATISQPDQDLEVTATLITSGKSSITAKSIDATGVTLENSTLSMTATNNITISNINTSGELGATSGNAGLLVDADGYVKIDGVTWAQNGYNAIEVGLNSTPKSVDIDNVHVTGTISNRAINVFNWQPNAVINIRNCSFASVCNMLQISNTSCNAATFNIINCTVDKWDTTEQCSGLICLEDYTSENEEEAKSNNQFAKIKINLINVVGPDGRMVGDTATFKNKHWFYTYYKNATSMEVTDDMLPTIEGK